MFDQLEGSSEDERKLLTTQRDKLEAERLKLVQAPYADAIPLDLLKSEQDRIRASLDQITTRLDNLADTYAEARAGLDHLTDLLVDLNDLYSKREPAKRRTLNGALFTRITIDDEGNATYSPDETTAKVLAHSSIDAPAHITAETKLPRHQAGRVSVFSSSVDAGGLKPNTWQRLERLSCAWNQAKLLLGDEPDSAVDDEPGVVANPRRRARTPLTESQVDALRTARANGESVVSICRRFNVHRMTVWTHTKDLVAQTRPTRRTPEADIVDTSILRRT
ncbi:helix-turn-helix domain-containing protein [Brevibacterium ravenspurgense]|uniref:helix-turn-helix domain-containing protein n=1 Tax=Brevibacterium ravenspurgense TaxID=479117 RepID=UPI0015E0D5F3|nr:helix-turn-helix domain-containing protein [Brevibacterium ravenspurgense]